MVASHSTNSAPANNDQSFFVPDLCGVRAVFVLVLGAQLLAFILVLAGLGQPGDFWPRLGMVSMFVQWVALLSAAVLCASRGLLSTLSVPAATGLSLALVLGACALVSELAWRLVVAAPGDTWSRVFFMVRNLAITAIVSSMALRYLYVQAQWRAQLVAETEARIAALQARIRPHFLFNSMNTIAALIRSQPEVAEGAVEDLADLFRASLADNRGMVQLAEELRVCRRYVRLEGLRLGDRLQVSWALDAVPDDLQVPALCLQPLLENAIYHGVAQLPGGGEVTVGGSYDGNELRLYVRNPVPGSSVRKHRGNRIALDNIRQRLELAWGHRGRLRQQLEDGWWQVQLEFPAAPAVATAGREHT